MPNGEGELFLIAWNGWIDFARPGVDAARRRRNTRCDGRPVAGTPPPSGCLLLLLFVFLFLDWFLDWLHEVSRLFVRHQPRRVRFSFLLFRIVIGSDYLV